MAENIFQGTRFQDQGTRKEVEQIAALGGVPTDPTAISNPGAAGGPMIAPPPPGGDLGVPSPADALAQMPTDPAAVTSGLSVGPGNTPIDPIGAEQAMMLSYEQKLVALATMAKSPHVRAQAVSALKVLIANMHAAVEK